MSGFVRFCPVSRLGWAILRPGIRCRFSEKCPVLSGPVRSCPVLHIMGAIELLRCQDRAGRLRWPVESLWCYDNPGGMPGNYGILVPAVTSELDNPSQIA